MISASLENPKITVNGQKIVFPVKLESGMSLEFNSATDCKLYGPKGEFLKDVEIEGIIPSLVSGENEISFSGSGQDGINPRVQVTVISEGKPLVNK